MHTFIMPTVGRVVWYRPTRGAYEQAAIVTGVVNGGKGVDLLVMAPGKYSLPFRNVPLVQDGEEPPISHHYCEWMPYQKGQAAKQDAAKAEGQAKAWERECEALGLVVHHDEPLCDGPRP